MMTHIMIGTLCALAVVLYWAICRKASLKHRDRSADLVVKYLESEERSEHEKEAVVLLYKGMTTWVFMPMMALLTPFAMIVMIVRSRDEDWKPKATEQNDILDALMKTYITRNPITSVICLAVIGVSMALLLVVGIAFNRIKQTPTLGGIYGTILSNAPNSKHLHA
ncbi:hypothetical protein P4209_29890 [Pseudomonas aeruginosa]|nr:hypothetical protein [Pseudomonas aeruginosa]MDF5860420.1 hypothetical protein [Pseudomonas aeruginosa]MDF5924900.1 hypothetical protein [Pseudomonas aeruginosa]